MADLANDFKKALQTVEKEKKPTRCWPFSRQGQPSNASTKDYSGTDGAKKFWEEYLSTFKTQTTTFHHTVDAEDAVVLEWTSKGELPNGKPLE